MGDKLQAVVENMLEEVRAHAQAERAAALTQAAVETCGYCNPKNMLNLVGRFDATGRNHVTPSGDLEPCKAWQIRALITHSPFELETTAPIASPSFMKVSQSAIASELIIVEQAWDGMEEGVGDVEFPRW